jgi:3'-phosphoadenosine 5'-phosphosulfate sulfotransferase (PAPS reductase)/FAD synthetase
MIESSREILQRAIAEHNPYAVVSMISGGKDSLCAYLVAQELGAPITHILHGVTGTGIPDTTTFVREFAATQAPLYLEANAGSSYEDYVQRKGFFGRGVRAHSYAYHLLKRMWFTRTLSEQIRQRKRNRPILLLNGARTQESANRASNLSNPIRADGPNIWVNIIHDWSKEQRDTYLDRASAPCNPVTQKLCRSGECLCGTSQNQGTREEAAYFFPAWGKWLDDLDRSVKAKFGWGWGENIPKWVGREASGQLKLFQPMCVDCIDNEEANDVDKG